MLSAGLRRRDGGQETDVVTTSSSLSLVGLVLRGLPRPNSHTFPLVGIRTVTLWTPEEGVERTGTVKTSRETKTGETNMTVQTVPQAVDREG